MWKVANWVEGVKNIEHFHLCEQADAEETDIQTKARMLYLSRFAFKKVPDAPLGEVILRKLKRRATGLSGRKSR